MPASPDPKSFPHTTPNDRPPQPGDLVFGTEGLLAVLCIRPLACTGLLINETYTGVVDIPLDEYRENFETRVLVLESIDDSSPETRLQ